jgi:hypothetical protein
MPANEQSFRISGGAGHATIFEVGLETKTITTEAQEVPMELYKRKEDIPVEIELLRTKAKCLAVSHPEFTIQNLDLGAKFVLGRATMACRYVYPKEKHY